MESILSDNTKFEEIINPPNNYIENLEEKFNDKLKRVTDKHGPYTLETNSIPPKYFKPILEKKSISQKLYDQVRSTGARAGVCYGLTKVHKPPQFPLRPIVSTIGTYNYNLSKYLSESLEVKFSKIFNFSYKDTFDFLNKMSKSKLEASDVMVSFDVVSLYTNVPIDETIELIKKNLSSNTTRYQEYLLNMKMHVPIEILFA